MAVQQLRRSDWGTPRKHIAKAAGSGAGGGLSDSERQDSEGNEPVGMLLSATSNNVMVTFDGTTPTTTVGHPIASDLAPQYFPGLAGIKNLDWIQQSASGELQITLYY